MIDVVKALAGWKGVLWVNAFKSSNSQKHPNGRAKCKKCLWVECQLWVVDRYLKNTKSE